MLVSTDAGATFTAISTGLPAISARSIVVDDNAEESMYVGMNIGVYYRDNVNTSWTLLGTGLPNVAINEVEINDISGKLRVGTYGRGVWETDLVIIQQPCNAPTALTATNITSASATISWNTISGATGYEFNYRVQGGSTWTVINVTTPTVNLSGLSATTIYEYQVMALCGVNGNSSFAQGTFTTTAVQSCGSPASVSVINSSANDVNVGWSPVANAISYNVEYKLNASSTWTSVNSTNTSLFLTSLPAGRYNVRVSAVCSGGSGTPTSGNNFLSHCRPSGISTTEFIDFVSLGSISRTSGSDGGYAYVAGQVTNLLHGSTQSVSFSAGFTGATTSERFAIYIDYNQDGDFVDAGELVAQRTNTNGNTFTRSFVVPTSAALGETRMRVMMRRGTSNPSSCLTGFNGEAEDYRVNIVASAIAESDLSTLAKDAFDVYPVPASDLLNIKYNAQHEGKILSYLYGMDGSIYKTSQHYVSSGENLLLIDTGNLSNGNYIIKMVKENEVHFGKVVIIH